MTRHSTILGICVSMMVVTAASVLLTAQRGAAEPSDGGLLDRVERLERQIADLQRKNDALEKRLGEIDVPAMRALSKRLAFRVDGGYERFGFPHIDVIDIRATGVYIGTRPENKDKGTFIFNSHILAEGALKPL